jgi:hypothetical protein
MSSALPTRAFLQIMIDDETWTIPQEYQDALQPHIKSSPADFFLPWPPELLPSVGAEIALYGLTTKRDCVQVASIDYGYSAGRAYTAYIRTADSECVLDLLTLLCFSEEGFLVEDEEKSIKEILDAAGLVSVNPEP